MTRVPQPLRVLVVDDELLLRWSLAEVLRRNGHTVVEAASAATARTEIANTSGAIDVVLLDYRLPDSDGLGLLQEIRTRMPHTAVVLMTAFTTPEIIQGALELGASSVMTKPFDMHAVDGVVVNAHQRARRR